MPDEVILNELLSSKKEEKIPKSIRETLYLAMQGYTFEAIASKRELSLFTISQHLSFLILHGFVDVLDFVDSHTYTLISNVIQELPKGVTIKRIKSNCPEEIKRNIIRMVIADLKRKKTK
nr:helix-turn-helix domain-containing protein [Prevotella sp. P6B4]